MKKEIKLWKKAKKKILHGNMLLSKRPEMHLPNIWPTYYSKAKGVNIWGIDNKKYIDMLFLVGPNTLGYANPKIDNQVIKTIRNGNMSSLNCPEEVYLAEKLIELHPWGNKVKFARSGGEANAIAIRIARAASGRDKVAICGYHGWHDWYLSANLKDKNKLNKHLLEGLHPKGVPSKLKNTVITFQYNDINGLKKIVENNKLAAIKMEVSRNQGPENNFLQKVRTLCDKHNIILIFDECTSGFRQTYGGLHKFYKVEPDMAMFGKALGNGYAITAVLGKDEIMSEAQDSFISSTFWTERVGPTAALATLDEMKRVKSWIKITSLGHYLIKGWKYLGEKYGVKLNISSLPALATLNFSSVKKLEYKTFLTQEMLKKKYLASTLTYLSTAHNKSIINRYIDELEPIFKILGECEDGNKIEKFLKTSVCEKGFKRLN